MKNSIKKFILLSLFNSLLFSNSISDLSLMVEEVNQEEHQKKERLEELFEQRMLAQQMAKNSLLLSLDYKTAFYKKELLRLAKRFDKGIKNLKETESQRVKRLHKTWSSFYKNIKIIIETHHDTMALKYITENNVLLLTDIDFILRKKIKSSQSSDSFTRKLQHGNFMLFTQIDIPRSYIQKIIKEKLMIEKELNIIEYRGNLNITIFRLERLLKGFREGDKTLELKGSGEQKFLKKLSIIDALWEELKPLYQKEVLTKKEFEIMMKKSDEFMKKHLDVVKLSNQIIDQ
jgi:hypothetical protein